MADPKLHVVIDALATALKVALAGAAYEPADVYPLLFWPDETALAGTGQETVYFVRPGRERRRLPDSGTVTSRLEVYILAVHRVGAAGNQLQDPRWQVSADLVADVMGKLLAAEATKVPPVVTYLDGEVEIDHERWTEQWVVPEMRITVRYRQEQNER